MDEVDRCMLCDNVIPDGTIECPGCHARLTFCSSDDCAKAYPRDAAFCPFCGTGNPAAARPASLPESAVPERLATPSGAQPAATDATPLPPAAATPVRSGAVPGDISSDPSSRAPDLDLALPGLLHAHPPAPVAGVGPLSTDLGAALAELGSLAGASTFGPVTLERDAGKSFRRGSQGLLKLRVRAHGLVAPARVRIRCDGRLFPATVLQAAIEPGETCEFRGEPFTPAVAGTEEIDFTVTLMDAAALPLARWRGRCCLEIAETEAGMQAGNDIIIMGGPMPTPAVLDTAHRWEPIELHKDRALSQQRLARQCPAAEIATPRPEALGALWPAARPLLMLLTLQRTGTAEPHAVAIACGTIAGLGRGGLPQVNLLVEPVPFDAYQANRLSRRHAVVLLTSQRAWLRDDSTNGVWLNGDRIHHAQLELLADGDEVQLAQVVSLRVGLVSDGRRVSGAVLYRGDGLDGRLSYCLTDNTAPVLLRDNVEGGPLGWLAIGCGPGDEPVLLFAPNAGALNVVPADNPRICEGIRVNWQRLSAPLAQKHCLEAVGLWS